MSGALLQRDNMKKCHNTLHASMRAAEQLCGLIPWQGLAPLPSRGSLAPVVTTAQATERDYWCEHL